jgi:hypothetical protein
MENENVDKEMGQYKVYLGKWINDNTPAFMFLCFEKDAAEEKRDLLGTYILIPKNGYELLDKQSIRTDSSLSDDIFCEEIRIATSRIESELNKEISRDQRDIYSDLFPYQLHEIEISELMDYYKLIDHEKLGQVFLSCLAKIGRDTGCNTLKNSITNLRECFDRI